MNEYPIETAQDNDLRLSAQAMQRAARRARELAARTGTCIVISRGGVIEEIRPDDMAAEPATNEPRIPYAGKP